MLERFVLSLHFVLLNGTVGALLVGSVIASSLDISEILLRDSQTVNALLVGSVLASRFYILFVSHRWLFWLLFFLEGSFLFGGINLIRLNLGIFFLRHDELGVLVSNVNHFSILELESRQFVVVSSLDLLSEFVIQE